jgi:hypothetical protein
VHVDRQGRGRRAVGESALLAADLGQREAVAAELRWHRGHQIAGRTQLLEVFLEEAVLPVVRRCALAASVDEALGQDRTGGIGDGHGSPPALGRGDEARCLAHSQHRRSSAGGHRGNP